MRFAEGQQTGEQAGSLAKPSICARKVSFSDCLEAGERKIKHPVSSGVASEDMEDSGQI